MLVIVPVLLLPGRLQLPAALYGRKQTGRAWTASLWVKGRPATR